MGHYARIGDVLTWYDDHGAGEPLLLLHGGLGDSRDFDGLLDDLTPHFRVLRPERRGHGRSPDAPGPTGYASMAEDTIRFLEDVVGGPAHLLGHGDGGTVALLTAIRRPDLVRRAVLVGAVFHHEGLVPELRAALAEHGVGQVPAPLALAHEEVSPHGAGHAQDLWERLMTMMSNEPALRREDLAGADVPVLVMSGDRDVVSLEHSVALYRGLPTASLAILPEATRSLIAEHPGLCGRIAGDFLRGATAPG